MVAVVGGVIITVIARSKVWIPLLARGKLTLASLDVARFCLLEDNGQLTLILPLSPVHPEGIQLSGLEMGWVIKDGPFWQHVWCKVAVRVETHVLPRDVRTWVVAKRPCRLKSGPIERIYDK
jgi:hypothetical protein